ncbi:MAG: DnaJ domain-containing protein [Acidobacteria bacterium]|nr:DnaJ domain-containing protein [Acidobacteriota bacterium]
MPLRFDRIFLAASFTTHSFTVPMTPQNPLDHKGSFKVNPFAELLVEIGQAKLGGSMRLSHGESRSIIYFRDGDVVFGVSNARGNRLLNILLDSKRIEQSRLSGLPQCANDVEFATMLVRENVLTKDEVDAAIVQQIEKIIIDALTWPDGQWHYSPLVRSREDLIFSVDAHKLMMDYARCVPAATVFARFRSVQERFEKIADVGANGYLQSHEDYVLQRFSVEPRRIEDLTLECGLPENGFLQTLYVLWLGGMLRRHDWNAAFSENRIGAIRGARVSLVKQASKPAVEMNGNGSKAEPPAVEVEHENMAADEQPQPENQVLDISLDEYLARVEAGKTHYDVLGVDPRAAVSFIKASYFSLAKLFHPDRYHREPAEMLQRIHSAFSSVQVAYDNLKSTDTRENYDFKIRKDLETREKLKAQGVKVEEGEKVDSKTEQGLENFEAGLSLLMDEEYDRAVPFLGRAAHYNPENALYRAYYGKALSYDEKQRHKAEGEIQAAAKLDPKNPKIRLMLVEFFMDNNLLKRAEGEVKRFLELAPDNADARRLLTQIRSAEARTQ